MYFPHFIRVLGFIFYEFAIVIIIVQISVKNKLYIYISFVNIKIKCKTFYSNVVLISLAYAVHLIIRLNKIYEIRNFAKIYPRLRNISKTSILVPSNNFAAFIHNRFSLPHLLIRLSGYKKKRSELSKQISRMHLYNIRRIFHNLIRCVWEYIRTRM